MKHELVFWVATVLLAVGVTVGIALGWVTVGVMLIAALGSLVAIRLGTAIATDSDRRWLPAVLLAAWIVKVIGAVARFVMVTVIYGVGDSLTYHRAGEALVHEWREFTIPFVEGRSPGTRFTEQATGFLYIPGVPTLMVGFLIFSFIAFLGIVMCYAAFRRSMPSDLHKPYAIAVFFLPSLVFWPSSVGKDALMIFAIGMTCLGAAWLFDRRHLRGILIALPGLALAIGVRAHVAAMLVGALVLAVALAQTGITFGPFLRWIAAAVAAVVLIAVGTTAAQNLGLEASTEGVEEFLTETEQQTAQGGSAVVGEPVRSPIDLPEAILRVIYRPLPGESTDPALILSSIEGGLFLLFTIFRLPTIAANLRYVRLFPYMIFSAAYSFAFVVAFSTIFNLGILARQRTQVHALLLAALIGLGWRKLAPVADRTKSAIAARRQPSASRGS